ncbi:MAG TPA: hypothetical protein VN549_00750 [Negativicutes bacterium]|nr:hypothetical protein [Negativicutes bacterium]
MNWLKKFMMGRYGSDQLSMALIILSIILNAVGSLVRLQAFVLLSYIPLVVCIYRIFSKDINKRRMENYKFTMRFSPIYSKLLKSASRMKDSRTHRYFVCPNCKTNLRVPKGKGNVVITCPKCKTELRKRT